MKIVYILSLFLVLLSCGSTVDVDYEKGTDFTSQRTFQFYEPERTGLNELDINRVEAAIDSVLLQKSWQRTDYNRFFISYYVENIAAPRRNTVGVGIGSGGGGFGIGGSVGIPIGARKFSQTLTIQIFKASEGQPLVWEGSLEADVKENATPEEKERHFIKTVSKILSKFPPEGEQK